MDILKIAIFALIATILIVTIKGTRPEIAILISVAACVMIATVSFGYLNRIFLLVNEITSEINLDISFGVVILKIISIAYICQISSQICKDAGENAISEKVELAGKILILFTSAPVITAFVELISEIV